MLLLVVPIGILIKSADELISIQALRHLTLHASKHSKMGDIK